MAPTDYGSDAQRIISLGGNAKDLLDEFDSGDSSRVGDAAYTIRQIQSLCDGILVGIAPKPKKVTKKKPVKRSIREGKK